MYLEIEYDEEEYDKFEKAYKELKESGQYPDICEMLSRIVKQYANRSQVTRNQMIFELRESGKTLKEIANQFGLTNERIRQIYQKEARRRNYEKTIAEAKKNKHCESFSECIDRANTRLGNRPHTAVHVFNVLCRRGIIQAIENGDITLDCYTDEELLNLRTFGVTCLEVARLANEIYLEELKLKEKGSE